MTKDWEGTEEVIEGLMKHIGLLKMQIGMNYFC